LASSYVVINGKAIPKWAWTGT